MKIGILTFEDFHGRKNIGSSRIRGKWLAENWGGYCEIAKIGKKYDVLIYQKVYWIEYAELIKKQNPDCIQILDICDADFLHWGYRIREMIDLMDGVSTSTPKLSEYFVKLYEPGEKQIWCIPDRMNLSEFGDKKKNHSGPTKIVGWFGYSENFSMLNSTVNSLIKLGIRELIVIANKGNPYFLPPGINENRILLTNFPWTSNSVNGDLLKCDVILNPQLNSGKWGYKSNNKTLTAWALGLPVAHNKGELINLMTEKQRKEEAGKRYKEIRELWNIKQSVKEWKEFINVLCRKRKQI